MFRRLALCLLLVQYISVKANTQPAPGIISKLYGEMQFGAATIYWKTYEPAADIRFIIERSDNGKDFTELAVVSSQDGMHFQYKDTQTLVTGFYRVKAVQADTNYSDILRLSSLSGIPQIKVLPLVFDAAITVEINSKINETFNVILTNSKGQELSSRIVNTEKGINTIVFDDGISFLYADEYTMSVNGIQYSFSQQLLKR